GQLRDQRVVVAGDRAVARYPDAGLGQRVDDAEGAPVVERADRGGGRPAAQQFADGAAAVVLGVAAGQHADVVAEAVAPHGGPVALPSLGGDGLLAAVDVGDIAV